MVEVTNGIYNKLNTLKNDNSEMLKNLINQSLIHMEENEVNVRICVAVQISLKMYLNRLLMNIKNIWGEWQFSTNIRYK